MWLEPGQDLHKKGHGLNSKLFRTASALCDRIDMANLFFKVELHAQIYIYILFIFIISSEDYKFYSYPVLK
jgi:hypothetical protein